MAAMSSLDKYNSICTNESDANAAAAVWLVRNYESLELKVTKLGYVYQQHIVSAKFTNKETAIDALTTLGISFKTV